MPRRLRTVNSRMKGPTPSPALLGQPGSGSGGQDRRQKRLRADGAGSDDRAIARVHSRQNNGVRPDPAPIADDDDRTGPIGLELREVVICRVVIRDERVLSRRRSCPWRPGGRCPSSGICNGYVPYSVRAPATARFERRLLATRFLSGRSAKLRGTGRGGRCSRPCSTAAGEGRYIQRSRRAERGREIPSWSSSLRVWTSVRSRWR